MKKVFCVLFVLITGIAKAQYTDSSLTVMTKGELTKIYLAQVNTLVDKLPYTVWGLGSQSNELDVPNSKYINNKRKSVLASSSDYTEKVKENLYEVVYYADKTAMIKAILYLQSVNVAITKVQ